MVTRVVFMGSPDFSVSALRALAGDGVEPHPYQVVGVVTQPDRPSGRGMTLASPPVKLVADELHVPVIQPQKLREPEALQQLQDWHPQLIVVSAFGQILRPQVLDLPEYGCINIHASLLPRWRGAAPIQAAIQAADAETGVTIMKMDPGLDTGPMLRQRAIPIGPQDTGGSLFARLAQLGGDLLLETLPGYLSGEILPQPQPDSGSTYAPMLKKEDGLLDFINRPAAELERQVRAFHPWPGTYLLWQAAPLKIHRAHVVMERNATPGKQLIVDGLPAIGTADGLLAFDELQPAGKKPMPGKAFLTGARDWAQ